MEGNQGGGVVASGREASGVVTFPLTAKEMKNATPDFVDSTPIAYGMLAGLSCFSRTICRPCHAKGEDVAAVGGGGGRQETQAGSHNTGRIP